MAEADCASRRRRQINIWQMCFMLRLEEGMLESKELGPGLLYLGKHRPVMLIFCYFFNQPWSVAASSSPSLRSYLKISQRPWGRGRSRFRLCPDLCLHILVLASSGIASHSARIDFTLRLNSAAPSDIPAGFCTSPL